MPQQRILLKGRLGNQMFIYAFARALNIRTGGETVLIDDWCQKKHVPCRLDCFNLSPEMKFGHGKGLGLLRRVVLKLAVLKLHNTKRCKRHTQELRMKPFLQKHGIFHIIDGYATLPENSLLQSRDFYMEGYFQSEKYFADYKKEILADFRFRQSLKDSCQPIAQQIIEANEPVCLHVRLGDYVQHSLHGVANVDYYRHALSLLREQKPHAQIFLFSDNIPLAKKALELGNDIISLPETCDDQQTMYLGSLCQHFIMSNSSFSWWMQYLSPHPGKLVFAPSKWYAQDIPSDLYLDNWHIVEV